MIKNFYVSIITTLLFMTALILPVQAQEASDSNGLTTELFYIENYESEMYIGDSQTLDIKFASEGLLVDDLVFESSDSAVARIDGSGEITALSCGETTITITCASTIKSFELKVKIPTDKIELKDAFISMYVEDTYQLTPVIYPGTADNELQYESTSRLLCVDATGKILAKECGVATIVVSNGNCKLIVTVAINQRALDIPEKDPEVDFNEEFVLQETYENIEVITSTMLKKAYEDNSTFKVVCSGYDIIIFGDKITNYSNQIYTNWLLNTTDEEIEFSVNDNNNLPGEIGIRLHNSAQYKYLYLYNESTKRYELLSLDTESDIDVIRLKTSGNYLLTNTKINYNRLNITLLLSVTSAIILICVIYLVVKKKYIFW